MANWYGASRTNYFKVKDAEVFKTFIAQFGSVDLWEIVQADETVVYGLGDNGEGYWPSEIPDDGSGEEIDFIGAVSEHLADGEVAVFMSSGAEKLRYVTGDAVAIRNDGERLQISIDDIYDLAKREWGVEPTLAQY